MTREPVVSVTASDCEWQYERGTGPGGQKRNKTETKVRCTHRASGAVGVSDETRDRNQNRKLAFGKMARSQPFQRWIKLEYSRRLGHLKVAEEETERKMREETRVEVKRDGRWVPESDQRDADGTSTDSTSQGNSSAE